MKRLINIVQKNKDIYISLVKNDFKSRFNGSLFGILWAIVQPMITILVYWFVFSIGLRSGDRPDGTPYILWLICGMVPWFFFSEALGAVSNSFIEYAYLVKKVQFRLGIIPLIKIGSSLIMHGIFFVIATIVLNFYGYLADWFYLQILYYAAVASVLLVGLGLLFSSITVFFRDMSQIVGIIIQIGFWVIPIVWGAEVLPPKLKIIFQMNPVYYIIEGYRESLLSGVPFWKHPVQMVYNFLLCAVVLVVGIKVFRKLRPNFSDVL